MKYYLIVGEASGDLHASNLMKSIKAVDADAEFRFFGGDLMSAVGGTRVKHYRELAYMGFIPVLMHLRTIFANMKLCKKDVEEWRPDALILVDYPGFNLSIAKYIHKNTDIPVYYYISPKIWAWKEHRIKNIKRDVDELFSILPFEIDFFEKKHDYRINYVGNPCVDAVDDFKRNKALAREDFLRENSIPDKPVVALLAGSRKQEIKANLPMMIEAMKQYPDYQPVIAGAPGIDKEFYEPFLNSGAKIVFGQTYNILNNSHAALVTSGTATLETALFNVPQVVCYATPMARLYSWLKKHFLKVKYVSLVNLVADREVVRELVAADMKLQNVVDELGALLPEDGEKRTAMLGEYSRMMEILGKPGASQRAAEKMVSLLSKNSDKCQVSDNARCGK
ncbi:MAG: lipid-A-disaccharide synthase [Bacteroidaceae bacterium]|nr:lipid-A-disaccharide synthase [Bacteroidaceae bacterium]